MGASRQGLGSPLLPALCLGDERPLVPLGVGGRGVTKNGYDNTPSDWVAMWRHVHNIFTSVGARNVSWVWCPNWTSAPFTYTPVSRFYPGDRYVDWTCLDGYNADDPWLSFSQVYGRSYQTIVKHIAPTKPMMLGEVSSTEAGGSKATWIRNMFAALGRSFPEGASDSSGSKAKTSGPATATTGWSNPRGVLCEPSAAVSASAPTGPTCSVTSRRAQSGHRARRRAAPLSRTATQARRRTAASW